MRRASSSGVSVLRAFRRPTSSSSLSVVMKDQKRLGRQLADGFRALHIQAHDHVFAACKRLAHLLLGDTLVIAVYDRIFDQFILLDHAGKFFFGDKEVIHPVRLRSPVWGASWR